LTERFARTDAEAFPDQWGEVKHARDNWPVSVRQTGDRCR